MTHEHHHDEPLYVTELKAELWSLRDSIAHQNRLLITLTHAVNQGFSKMSANSDASAAAITALQTSVDKAVNLITSGSGGGTASADQIADAAALPAAISAMQDASSKLDNAAPATPVPPVPTPVSAPRSGF